MISSVVWYWVCLGMSSDLRRYLKIGPEDQEQDEAADDEPGDEEELPQVELGAALCGGPRELAEAREFAAAEDERTADHGRRREQPGATSRAGNFGCRVGCVRRRAGQ